MIFLRDPLTTDTMLLVYSLLTSSPTRATGSLGLLQGSGCPNAPTLIPFYHHPVLSVVANIVLYMSAITLSCVGKSGRVTFIRLM